MQSIYTPQIQDWYREDKIWAKDRRYFFTSVDPTNKEHRDPNKIDLGAPRLAWYKQKKWRRHQDTVYWVDIQLAQRKGFKFYQTRSNAIILYDTLTAYCIPKAIMMETGEIIYEKVFASPRPPPKMSFKDNWMKELDSEVAGGLCRLPTNPTKIKNPITKNGETCKWATTWFAYSGDRKRCLVWLRKHQREHGETWKSCEPVSVERLDKDKDADENVDADQISTGGLVSGQSIGLFTQREEIYIDFRMSGAENFRVRELVKKIESHPHREALQADLQQNNVYNPFSDDAIAMIREMGNVELFELCETNPKMQCAGCLLYWNRGDLLHLWTSLGWKRIQSKFWSMAAGCSLHPA